MTRFVLARLKSSNRVAWGAPMDWDIGLEGQGMLQFCAPDLVAAVVGLRELACNFVEQWPGRFKQSLFAGASIRKSMGCAIRV